MPLPRPFLHLLAAAFAGLLLTSALAARADAATTFGSSLGHVRGGSFFVGASTAANEALPTADTAAGGLEAPADGVVVRWRLRTNAQTVPFASRLRVIRDDTGIASSADVTVPAGSGVVEFASRVPVRSGDSIGIDVPADSEANVFYLSEDDAVEVREWTPTLAEGETREGVIGAGTELLLNADVEPDADADGYGDESQDACPSDPTRHAQCAGLPAPHTRIDKAPARKLAKRKATVQFSSDLPGAAFECALDGKPFRPCSSPLRLRRLRAGRHRVEVRAVLAGVADATPAAIRFKVRRPRR